MSRPVPPQVIPRPQTWRPGGPAPWAEVSKDQRTGIAVDRILDALVVAAQSGPVPAELGPDAMFESTVALGESSVLGVRRVNSAVLAVLFEEHGEARLIFTRRSTALRTHRGEVSFPGGRLDGDEEPVAGALREAFEEVNLDPATVTVVGWIQPVMTMVSDSLILPVLSTVDGRPDLIPSPAEVERVFDVSLSELADPSIFHEERWSIPGREIPGSDDNSFPVWFFEVSGEMIWGATARMIYELLTIVLVGPPRA
jgi:8-oxo-dGTP pyrophosphatase MutT (NUDIX family)